MKKSITADQAIEIVRVWRLGHERRYGFRVVGAILSASAWVVTYEDREPDRITTRMAGVSLDGKPCYDKVVTSFNVQ